MYHKNHYHHLVHLFHKDHKWNPEILEFYIFLVLRFIAFGLLVLFVPIFLYVDLGYSFLQIVLFWMWNQVFFFIITPFSGAIIQKIGIKKTLLLHIPGLIVFAYGLRFLTGDFLTDALIFIPLLIIRSSFKAPYYAAQTLFISKHVLIDQKKEGSSISKIKIVLLFAALISPLIGGFVSYVFGFEAFFNMAIVFLIAASIPLLITKDFHHKIKATPKEVFQFTLKQVPKEFKIAEFGRWFPDSIVWMLWPIFLILIAKTTLNMGIITSISFGVGMLLSYHLGKQIDKKNPKQFLSKVSKVASGIFFVRTLFPNPFILLIADTLNNIVYPMVQIPYEKYIYDYIKSVDDVVKMATASSLILEICYSIGFVFLLLVFGILELLSIPVTVTVLTLLFIVFGSAIMLMPYASKIKPSSH